MTSHGKLMKLLRNHKYPWNIKVKNIQNDTIAFKTLKHYNLTYLSQKLFFNVKILKNMGRYL